jgi:hypothetical protein
VSKEIKCPNCGGALVVMMLKRIRLLNVDGVIAFNELRGIPIEDRITCTGCDWTAQGTWKGVADMFGLKVAEK